MGCLRIHMAPGFLDSCLRVAAALQPRVSEQRRWSRKWFQLLQSAAAHLLPRVLQMGMFTDESAERSRSCAGINRFFDDVRLASHPHPAVLSPRFSLSPYCLEYVYRFFSKPLAYLSAKVWTNSRFFAFCFPARKSLGVMLLQCLHCI